MVYRMTGTAFRVHYIYPKKKYYCILDQKVEEAKIRIMIQVRVHVMGCWEGGHM